MADVEMHAGWDRYYSDVKDVRPFYTKTLNYEASLSLVNEYAIEAGAPLFDNKRPMKFVLGGFNPHNGTPQAFRAFCERIHPNPLDELWYVDVNQAPLDTLPENERKMRSSIQELDISAIDVLFLDEVLPFLTKDELAVFARNTREHLSPNGVVVSSMAHITKLPWSSWKLSRIHKVPTHAYSSKDVKKAVGDDLKVVVESDGKAGSDKHTFSTLVMSRPDSIYPVHEGPPFTYTNDSMQNMTRDPRLSPT